jgi:hypothetical protein
MMSQSLFAALSTVTRVAPAGWRIVAFTMMKTKACFPDVVGNRKFRQQMLNAMHISHL